jgi:tetratricopeptide (TPR) repeat protein
MSRRNWCVGKGLPGNFNRYSWQFVSAYAFLALLAFFFSSRAVALAEEITTNSPPATSSEANTNTQEILRAYLQLQEQLHLTQLAVEQNRKEARDTATQTSEALAGRLQGIELMMASERSRERESMQSSNRVLLILAGTFAGVGFFAMLLSSIFQWRTVSKLAQMPNSFSAPALGVAPGLKELSSGDHVVSASPAEASSLRLLTAVEHLDQRLHQLEHSTRASLPQATPGNGTEPATGASAESGVSHRPVPAEPGSSDQADDQQNQHVLGLLGKGQSMLSLDDPHGAITCFEEVLQLDPQNAEAWVRKGTALERLQQLDQAIECYDRALQADSSLTVAYLHKGGLFNRLERFSEALECYEKALRTQEKSTVS